MKLDVQLCTPADIDQLVPHISEADVLELMLSTGEGDTRKTLLESLEVSTLCLSIHHAGRCIAIFGVSAPMGPSIGCPWLIATDDLRAKTVSFHKLALKWVSAFKSKYPVLINYTHVDNKRAIGWLKRLGFSFGQAVPYGPAGALFYPFTMKGGTPCADH